MDHLVFANLRSVGVISENVNDPKKMWAQPPKMEAQWRETEKSVIFNIFWEAQLFRSVIASKKKVFFQAIFIFFQRVGGLSEGPVRQPQV